MDLYDLFDQCNETELHQIARRAGLPVLPNLPKDTLIRCILGEVTPPPLQTQEVDEWRLTIMQFVLEHRRKLETQLTCPAKTMDPYACFNCVDAQVVHCLVSNKTNMNALIAIRKKITQGR